MDEFTGVAHSLAPQMVGLEQSGKQLAVVQEVQVRTGRMEMPQAGIAAT